MNQTDCSAERLLCMCDLAAAEYRRITEVLCGIAQQHYVGCGEQDLGTVDYWLGIRNSDFCFYVEVDGTPVAYLDFLALSAAGEQALLTQEVYDGEMPTEHLNLAPSKNLTLYATGVMVVPEHRGAGLAGSMLRFAREWFCRHCYEIEKIYAIVWSEAGGRLARRLGGVPYMTDSRHHERVVVTPRDKKLPLRLDWFRAFSNIVKGLP